MTRKHYIELARRLKDARQTPDLYDGLHDYYEERGINKGLDIAAKELCSVLIKDNSNFDKNRFLEAAGVED